MEGRQEQGEVGAEVEEEDEEEEGSQRGGSTCVT